MRENAHTRTSEAQKAKEQAKAKAKQEEKQRHMELKEVESQGQREDASTVEDLTTKHSVLIPPGKAVRLTVSPMRTAR